jgi:phage tail-like protein
MAKISSFISYLPPVLWSQETDPDQFLARMLCIFEKILTGIDDDVALEFEGRAYQPLEVTIDNLARMFDPWRTRSDLLPWLATWVGIDPSIKLPELSEYQQRRMISAMAGIFRGRGLKEDLLAFLEIYTASEARPRIAIDEGITIFRAAALTDGTMRLHPICFSSTVDGAGGPVSAPLHPSAITVDPLNNNYIVADLGKAIKTVAGDKTLPGAWRISSSAEPAIPIHQGDPFFEPLAIVADSQQRYAVIDGGYFGRPTLARSSIYRFAPPNYELSTIVSPTSSPPLNVVRPVAMILDQDERFLILDRGMKTVAAPAIPKLVRVGENPLTVEVFDLQDLIAEPTAMALQTNGKLIIADGQNQSETTPADLVEFDFANPAVVRSLLGELPALRNPLVDPCGLAFETPETLLVCDTGLRRPLKDRSVVAEPAAIYRVDLSASPPEIMQVSVERSLVNPTDMTIDRYGALLITDRGEEMTTRNWRLGTHEFGIIVHFSEQRPTSSDERKRIRREVVELVADQKPAHTTSWIDS